MAIDNWIHKGVNMLCGTCIYYAPKGASPKAGPGSDVAPAGRCRRHAPTMSGYPSVFDDDWCGDHKLTSQAVEGPRKGKEF